MAQAYSEIYQSDEKLVYTAGSASDGKPGICGYDKNKNPIYCHQTHQKGSCIDLRYMNSNGQDVKGDTAYKLADVERTQWLIKAFAKENFTKFFTGDDTRFGQPDDSKGIDRTENVHRHHLHVGYKP